MATIFKTTLQLSEHLLLTLRTSATSYFSLTDIYKNQKLWSSTKMTKPTLNPLSSMRTFATSEKRSDNYEGDGKTTVTILNREYKHIIMIDTYSSLGFRINNGIYAIGPLAVFPKTILHWNVNTVEELTPECFSLFGLLDPKLDILVLGTGDYRMIPGKEILQYLKSCRISVEILPTAKAISLFNFLNAEGRCVAGAFIPPLSVVAYEDEIKILEEVEAIDDYSIKNPSKKLET